MPRAGSGGGRTSSPRRSSGGHSSSRSSGGHRISSRSSGSNRAGSARSTVFRSSSSSSYRRSAPPPPSFGGTRTPPPPPFRGPGMPLPRRYSGRTYRGNYYGGSPSSPAVSVIASVIVLVVILFFVSVFFSAISSAGRSNGSALPASTRNREKLNAGLSFDSGCIVDEIGWFDSVSAAGRQLRTFYDKTGVQPYIVLLQHHPELTTDSQKESYAQDYYEDNIDNEATFLYMYFAEEDVDNDVGYMCYVNGKQVDSVMDAEAVDIFWGYLDRNWYSGMSTDELFVNAFTRTAETIMAKTRTKTDIIFILVAGVVIIGIIAAVITAMKTKRRHERERAEETQRILNTPLPDDPLSSQGKTQTNNNIQL